MRRTVGALFLAAVLTASGAACGGTSTYTGLVSCTRTENVEGRDIQRLCSASGGTYFAP